MELNELMNDILNIECNSQALGCGLEDRNITDRYEAMKYGWDMAMQKVEECLPDFE